MNLMNPRTHCFWMLLVFLTLPYSLTGFRLYFLAHTFSLGLRTFFSKRNGEIHALGAAAHPQKKES